ncbi:MAG: acyl-CoA reductase, partial [Polyangiales bacterium]
MPLTDRAEAIAQVARRLLDRHDLFGAELRSLLLASSGLCAEVIELGVRTTFGAIERDALLELRASRPSGGPPALTVAVLAGNVWSAAVRPLLLPLLCGAPVLAKASSQDAALPTVVAHALTAVDARLGDACGVLCFAHGDRALDAALLRHAETVSAYGSDEAIAEIAAAMPSTARLVAHGHGLGVIAVPAEALGSEAAGRALASRAAIDVAAYDQRGCLSPQAVLVQSGGVVSARELARYLADALMALARELPRGKLPEGAAAEQLQWRGVAAALGELHASADCAVSHEGTAALRSSPGYRNIAIYDCADLAAMRDRLLPLGPHLKALGIAAVQRPHALCDLAPYVCEVGAMQSPPLATP